MDLIFTKYVVVMLNKDINKYINGNTSRNLQVYENTTTTIVRK